MPTNEIMEEHQQTAEYARVVLPDFKWFAPTGATFHENFVTNSEGTSPTIAHGNDYILGSCENPVQIRGQQAHRICIEADA